MKIVKVEMDDILHIRLLNGEWIEIAAREVVALSEPEPLPPKKRWQCSRCGGLNWIAVSGKPCRCLTCPEVTSA